jgi:hypothetical protein
MGVIKSVAVDHLTTELELQQQPNYLLAQAQTDNWYEGKNATCTTKHHLPLSKTSTVTKALNVRKTE